MGEVMESTDKKSKTLRPRIGKGLRRLGRWVWGGVMVCAMAGWCRTGAGHEGHQIGRAHV